MIAHPLKLYSRVIAGESSTIKQGNHGLIVELFYCGIHPNYMVLWDCGTVNRQRLQDVAPEPTYTHLVGEEFLFEVERQILVGTRFSGLYGITSSGDQVSITDPDHPSWARYFSKAFKDTLKRHLSLPDRDSLFGWAAVHPEAVRAWSECSPDTLSLPEWVLQQANPNFTIPGLSYGARWPGWRVPMDGVNYNIGDMD